MEHAIINGIGQRQTNQDEWIPKYHAPQSPFFMVCDGVGGANHGDIASKITTDAIATHLNYTSDYSQNGILEAIIYAENALDIFKLKNKDAKNMSTTMGILAFSSSGKAIASWVGDSRIYQIRDGEIIYKSIDHSLGQYFLQRGLITEEQLETFPRKNIITKGITGCDRSAIPDFHQFHDIKQNDYFLICSDGFYEVVYKEDFKLFNSSSNTEEIKTILDEQCRAYSKDNYTCHILKI